MNYNIEVNNKHRAIKIISDTIETIKQESGKVVKIPSLPFKDKKTMEMFKECNTTGVFLFEMAKIRHYLRLLNPSCFDELVALCSLYYSNERALVPEYIESVKLIGVRANLLTLEYVYIAYQTAFFKAYYTEPFMVVTLKNHFGDENWVNLYMNGCKRLEIKTSGLE